KVILAISMVLLMSQPSRAFVDSKEVNSILASWNFTPANYTKLTRSGRHLGFDVSSAWFPAELKANLLATLTAVLGGQFAQPSADGVNVHDFFHGHFACAGAGSADQAYAQYNQVVDQAFADRGLQREQSPRNFDVYIQAISEAEVNAG